jgi:hypothetical protein
LPKIISLTVIVLPEKISLTVDTLHSPPPWFDQSVANPKSIKQFQAK